MKLLLDVSQFLACWNNDIKMVELLLKEGANIEAKDNDGQTSLILGKAKIIFNYLILFYFI